MKKHGSESTFKEARIALVNIKLQAGFLMLNFKLYFRFKIWRWIYGIGKNIEKYNVNKNLLLIVTSYFES